MKLDDPIRLIIIETNKAKAEDCNTRIRRMGIAVRSLYFKDGDDITDLIDNHQPDVILLRYQHPEVNVKDLNSYISTLDCDIPIIILHDTGEELDTSYIINSGGTDMVDAKDNEHLRLVLLRSAKLALLERELKRISSLYAASEELSKSLIYSSKDAIAYIHEGMHVYANPSYLERFGYSSIEDIEGMGLMELVPKDKQQALKLFLRDLDVSAGVVKTELLFNCAEGEAELEKVEFSPANIDGEECAQLLIRHEVPEVDTKELEEKLSAMARIDHNTGMLNRATFMQEFDSVLKQMAANPKLEFAYYHIAIDDFSKHVSTLGLAGSDQLISQVAHRMREDIDCNNPLCRYDGAVFSYLAPIQNRTVDVKNIGNDILASTNGLVPEVNGKTVHNLSFSLGACLIDDPSLSIAEIIERSNKALQKAISGSDNGNAMAVYQPKEGELSQAQIDKHWAAKIEAAIKSKRIQLAFQPILKPDSDKVPRYEVFLTMRDENNQMVPESDFIAAAERTGMAVRLDRWITHEALKALASALPKEPQTQIFIKLTNNALKDHELYSAIKTAVTGLKLPSNSVVFDLWGKGVTEYLKQANAFIRGLKAIGCNASIHNVDLEPEALKIFLTTPVNYVKFAGSLTRELITDDELRNKLAEAFNHLRAEHQRKMILTDVNDPSSLSIVWSVGADFFQGNFIGKASDSMDFDFKTALG